MQHKEAGDDARLVRIEDSLSRVESMLVWLCEAMAGEEDEEDQVASSLSDPATRPVERRASL